MSNPINPDEQLANYIDGLVPAISLEDITRMSRSEITVLPISLDGEQNTMNKLVDYPSDLDSVPEITLISRGPETRRNRLSLWAGGAVAAAAAVVVIGYMINGANVARTTTSTGSTAASDFAESDGIGIQDAEGIADAEGIPDADEAPSANVVPEGSAIPEADGTPEAGANEVVSTAMSASVVVRTNDGSFITYANGLDPASGTTQTSAMRSSDGQNWEPIAITGLPPGLILNITQDDQLFVAVFTADLDTAISIAVSSDGINWIPIANPPAATTPGYISYIEPIDAARLADGRYLVVGSHYSNLDFEALGIDEDEACETDESGAQLCDDASLGLGLEQPIEANSLWTVEADGTNPTPVSAPEGLEPAYESLTSDDDGVVVKFSSVTSEGMTVRGTTSDALNWEIEPDLSGSSWLDPQANYNGTTYQTDSSGSRLERSDDGGTTWTATAPLDVAGSIDLIAAGPAGVVVVANTEFETFTYAAADGTRLTGRLPDTDSTWVLTTPAGETVQYYIDESLLNPGSSPSDSNVTVSGSDAGDEIITLRSPSDGSTLLTVTTMELYEAINLGSQDAAAVPIDEIANSISATVDKDGYKLFFNSLDETTAEYALIGPDGTELLTGTFDDQYNPNGEGVEVLQGAMLPEMRFFDPSTGQDFVTFSAMDLGAALVGAASTAMEQVSTPITIVQDGYTLDAMVPAGEWTVTNADGTVIATFASPLVDDYLNFGSPTGSADDAVRFVDPLTKDVTILSNGAPVVTFAYDEIVQGSGDIWEGSAGWDGAIFFSADQGATWQELSRINGWVSSVAVGDDEILVTSETAAATPVRLSVAPG